MGVTIMGAAGRVKEQYEVSNSIRFVYGDSIQMTRTPSSEGNRRTWTWSAWIKRGDMAAPGNGHTLWNTEGTDCNTNFIFQIDAGGGTGGATDSIGLHCHGGDVFTTAPVLRDIAAWYHIVLAMDTTQSTAGNRIKLWLNGESITISQESNYPAQNYDFGINDDVAHYVGSHANNANYFFDGYMSEVHFVEGSAKEATDFGEFDDNNVWIPKRYTGAYGTNGYFLEFKQTGTGTNASGMGADTSGNDNHFAVTNLAATDVSGDNPNNNFCVWNDLRPEQATTVTEGNTYAAGIQGGSGSEKRHQIGTIMVNRGKWYFELKVTGSDSDNNAISVGVSHWANNTTHGTTTGPATAEVNATDIAVDGSAVQSSLAGFDQNDIVGIFLNCDDEEVTFYKNGSAYGSAADYSGVSAEKKLVSIYAAHGSSSTSNNVYLNAGCPAFSISSSNADANGYGNFEYSPVLGGTNYYALCTKNLAEYG